MKPAATICASGTGAPSSHASNLRTSFVARIAITRKLLCDHRAPLCCYLLGRRKAKWSRCSPRISVSLPHLHAVARQLRRPSPEASSIADAALATSATSFVDSNCGYPDHRIVRWPRSAAVSVPPSFHSKSNNATQAGPTPAMATVIRAVAAFSVRGTGSSWTPT